MRTLSDDVMGDVIKVAVIEGVMPHVVQRVAISAFLTVLLLLAVWLRHRQRVRVNGRSTDGRFCKECGRPWGPTDVRR